MKKLFKSEAFAVLKIPGYRYFLAFRFIMTLATLMQSVVVSWHLYNITKDVLSLGLIGLTEVIPQIGIALFAGHYIDIGDRKRIIFNTVILLVFGAAILLIYSLPVYDSYILFGTLPIFLSFFLTGLARGVLMPANAAILGQIVPRELFANAATWNSTNWHVAAVIGPAMGGLIYGYFGVVTAYSVIFILLTLSLFLIAKIRVRQLSNIPEITEGIVSRIKEGISYVLNNKILLSAFTLDMFAVLFGGAVAMLPVFASDILNIGPEGLGLLRATPAIGAILMSVLLMARPPVHKTGNYLFLCIAGFGLCMIGFALSKNFYLSGLFLLLSGAFDNVSVIIRSTIFQLFTPEEMRGRVAAVNSIFIGSSNELGAFESGVAAKFMGLVPSVVFGGAMTLLVVGVTVKASPVLRRLSLKKSISGI